MPRPEPVDVVNCLVHRANHADRKDERQELTGEVVVGGGRQVSRRRSDGCPGLVGHTQFHTLGDERLGGAWQELRSHIAVHQQRLGRVAHAWPLALGIYDNREGIVQIG